MKIYCCGCEKDIEARLTTGDECYPHRKDLYLKPFWKCDECKGFVGCHHKDRIEPLKHPCVIPTPEIKSIRSQIHLILYALWKGRKLSRSKVYSDMTKLVGWSFHAAEIRSLQSATECLNAARVLAYKYKRGK